MKSTQKNAGNKFAGPWANGVLELEQASICQICPPFLGRFTSPYPSPGTPGPPFGNFFSTLFPSTFSTHFLGPPSTPPGSKNNTKIVQKSTLEGPNGAFSFPSLFVRFSLRSGTQFEALGRRLVATFLSLSLSFLALPQHRAFHETL